MQGYKKNLLLFIVFIFGISSCISYKNTLILQDENLDSLGVQNIELTYSNPEYIIQKGDFLDIKIQSPDAGSLIFFNKESSSNTSTLNEGALYLKSFIVDVSGDIYMPILGKFNVDGITVNQLRAIIKERLNKYFKISDVSVKLVSFKVTFIGEVSQSKTIFIYNMNTTFYEGLSKVGGATEFTNTHKVTILRKINNKNIKAEKLDINSLDFVKSEYYYLKPGDIIYLEPIRYKTIRKNIPLLSFVFSATTFLITLIALSRR